MKPGKNDIPVKLKISGRQLTELQKHTWQMCEAFGLDRKIENYKGTRPISLYSWDLDCIIDVLWLALDDKKEYPDKEGEGYILLHDLYIYLKKAHKEIHGICACRVNTMHPAATVASPPSRRMVGVSNWKFLISFLS